MPIIILKEPKKVLIGLVVDELAAQREREHKRQTLKQQEDKEETIIDNIPAEDMIQNLQLAIEPNQSDNHHKKIAIKSRTDS